MFDYIISQVRRPFDNAVAALVGKIAVAIPLLVAAIFLISALNNYLHTLWGPVGANLAMAGLFLIIAAIAAMIFASRRDRDASETEARQEKAAAPARRTDEPGLVQGIADRLAATPHERELVLSVATTAVPFLLPRIVKLSLRHWQIVGAAAAGYYLFGRLNGPRRAATRRVRIAGTGSVNRPAQTRRIK